MNVAVVTGFLTSNADERFTPGGARKLTFDFVVLGKRETRVPYSCEIHDEGLIARASALLTAGRACTLRCELDGRPFIGTGGVQKGWSRFLKVIEAEFPDRSSPKKEDEKLDEKAPVEAANGP